tara:strand:+ start:2011 stop:3636 length:1626 start_codon:yes stop_codon:yes gene_type:complete
MANQDLMRMLTGVSSGQQPVMQQPVAGSPNFRGAFGAQQNRRVSEGLGRAVRGGAPSDQERLAAAEAKLDLNTVEGLTTLAKIQQIRGDREGAAKTSSQANTLRQQAKREEDTLENRAAFADYIAKTNPELKTLALNGVLTPANFKTFIPQLSDKERYKVVGANVFDMQSESFIKGPQAQGKAKDSLIVVGGKLYDAETKRFIDVPQNQLDPLKEQRLYNAVKESNAAIGVETPSLGEWLDRNNKKVNTSPDKKVWNDIKSSNDALGLSTPNFGDWYNANNVKTSEVKSVDSITGLESSRIINLKTGETIRELGVTKMPEFEIIPLPDGTYRVDNKTTGSRGEVVETPQAAKLRQQQMMAIQNELFAIDETMGLTTEAERLANDENATSEYGFYAILSRLPFATDSSRLADVISSLKGNLAFDELSEMRKRSPTGGALGQVSNIELKLLENAVSALNPSTGVETFNKQLERVRKHYDNFKRSVLGVAPSIDYGSKEYEAYMKTPNNPQGTLSIIKGMYVMADPQTGEWYNTGVTVKPKKED